MSDAIAIWIVAGSAATSTIASSVLDVLLAILISDVDNLSTVRALLFAAFSLQIIAIGCVLFYSIAFSVQKSPSIVRKAWLDSGVGAGFSASALAVTGAPVIWLLTKSTRLAEHILVLSRTALAVWAVSVVLHGAFFMLLARQIRKIIEHSLPRGQAQTFGIHLPPANELAYGSRPSFCSRDTTLGSRPETPTSSRTYSLPSSATRMGSSLRSKFTRHSTRSSLDLPAFPAGEATALGNAFDRYDSSHVDFETRHTVIASSPTFIRSMPGLETIPGSRPGSPQTDSGSSASSPTPKEPMSSPPAKINSSESIHSTPLSNPPNFSRPVSRSQFQNELPSLPSWQTQASASMTDLIHPLFRPDSPSPPQILSHGTMVTASPLANQLITPTSLAELRSSPDLLCTSPPASAGGLSLSSKCQWRVMSPVETGPATRPRSRSYNSLSTVARQPSISGPDGGESTELTTSDAMGSPGPSIIEEDELPPILPGFVLSAGSRSSLVEYGKRKSVKRDSAALTS